MVRYSLPVSGLDRACSPVVKEAAVSGSEMKETYHYKVR